MTTKPGRIVVVGATGQLARALRERDPARVVVLGRPLVDLEEPRTIAQAIAEARPDAIVNAAAYTAVDKAEDDEERATRVNALGAGLLATEAARLGVPFVHISTDYVFDGALDRPYREDDPVAPLGAYGRSKLAGEMAVQAATDNYVILRTAWVYSPFGANFVKTMLRLGRDRTEVRVVHDQRGCPTSAHDLADAVLTVAENLVSAPHDRGLRGTFHAAGSGEATWAEFAEHVFATAAAVRATPRVVRISTSDYPTRARRPANSRLDCSRLAARHRIALPQWEGAVAMCVRRLLDEEGVEQP